MGARQLPLAEQQAILDELEIPGAKIWAIALTHGVKRGVVKYLEEHGLHKDQGPGITAPHNSRVSTVDPYVCGGCGCRVRLSPCQVCVAQRGATEPIEEDEPTDDEADELLRLDADVARAAEVVQTVGFVGSRNWLSEQVSRLSPALPGWRRPGFFLHLQYGIRPI